MIRGFLTRGILEGDEGGKWVELRGCFRRGEVVMSDVIQKAKYDIEPRWRACLHASQQTGL